MKKTQSEKDYHDYLASLPCIACGDYPVHVHHVRLMGQRSNNHWFCLSLCPSCHQGKDGIHDSKKTFEMRFGSEVELLAKTIEQMWERR